MIRMDSNVDLYIERRTSSRQIEPRAENSQPTQNTETGHGRRASARARGLKFATTGFAEVAQWIHLLDQCRQVDECPVGGKIGFDDQLSRLLGRFNHSIACKDFHPSYECIQVNELHNFRILASEGIDVKPRCFFNKALVELFALRGGSQSVADTILAAPSYPAVKIAATVPDAVPEKDARAGTYSKSISFSFLVGSHGPASLHRSCRACMN